MNNNFYGEQYVFTDEDLKSVTGYSLPIDEEDFDEEAFYRTIKNATDSSIAFPTGSHEVGQKVAISHSDNLDLVVDNHWIKLMALHKSPDGTINQNEHIADGFIFYHNQPNNKETEINIVTEVDNKTVPSDQVNYGDLIMFTPIQVDQGGHAKVANSKQVLKMPITICYDREGQVKTWDGLTQEDRDSIAPPAMKFISPLMTKIKEDTEKLNTEVFNTQTTENSGNANGLVDRVATLE
jgi:hypothetical protein